MTTINQSKLSKEVKEKYSVKNNAFLASKIKNAELDKHDGKPKDEINIIVGDDKQPDFLPQVKLCRWSNETNFSIRLKDTEVGEAKVSTTQDKIKWSRGNIDIEFYDYEEGEGGYKMVWYLKNKPKTNKIEFTVRSKGLNFYHQPPLTEEYQSGYSEEFKKEIVVTETQVKDLEGNVLVERPEKSVGSYAVYHSTKGKFNDSWGKEYRTGKAFHIYRPKITDSVGNFVYGKLKIDIISGIYYIEIPQEFLEKATYPIRANDVFGNNTTGDTNHNLTAGNIYVTYPWTATSNATIDQSSGFNFYRTNNASVGPWRPVIYQDSDDTIIDYGPEDTCTASETTISSDFNQSGSLVSGSDYMIGVWLSGGLNVQDDSAGSTRGVDAQAYHATNSPPSPLSIDSSRNDRNECWWITYTPTASGPTKLKTWNGLSNTKIKTINSLDISKVKTINGLS